MNRSIAIIGAGPIGVEAAILAQKKGWKVDVFESGDVGQAVADWGHVRLFSPWALNRSTWGNALLGAPEHPDEFPTGREFRSTYLLPLAEHLGPRLHLHTRVLGVARRDALKGDFLGKRQAHAGPFVLHLKDASQERYHLADIVFDTSGVYETPAKLGPGGLSALGEDALSSRIIRSIPDTQSNPQAFENKDILLIGGGHSAVTTLRALHTLETPRVHWIFRNDSPYPIIADDPLPQRMELAHFGNAAARGDFANIHPLPHHQIESLQADGERLIVSLGKTTINVDQIISNVGYVPNLDITRELQVHHCWASEGPMKLAATLLAASGGADCLTQTSAGVATLLNPEPNFFVLGSKSYGRNSSFLLKLGLQQIEEVLDFLVSPI
jgi:thioredoxin reductase